MKALAVCGKVYVSFMLPCVWNEYLNRSNQVCLAVVLFSRTVEYGEVGELCMWFVWDNLKRSSELSILIALSIKQRRQLGDSGRAQRCRSPLVYFFSYSALFVYFPPAPHPVPQHLPLRLTQQWPLRRQERWAEEGSGGESQREKREST